MINTRIAVPAPDTTIRTSPRPGIRTVTNWSRRTPRAQVAAFFDRVNTIFWFVSFSEGPCQA